MVLEQRREPCIRQAALAGGADASAPSVISNPSASVTLRVLIAIHYPRGRRATSDNRMMTIERTDFVSIPVQNMERAKAFYRDVLGMQSPNWEDGWPEIESGNVSLYLVDPTAMGSEFAPHVAPIALRVPDVPEARRELEERGVEFSGEHDTGVCKMAFFRDTEGNALMLHRRYAP